MSGCVAGRLGAASRAPGPLRPPGGPRTARRAPTRPPPTHPPPLRRKEAAAPAGAAGGAAAGAPSFWGLKPWWCQPWSILLTGSGVTAGSWLALHLWWVTGPVALGVGLWWLLFLVLVPQAYAEEFAGRGAPPPGY